MATCKEDNADCDTEFHKTPTPDIEISVISGELNETKADVIVNTTSKDLNLSNGKVSQALLRSAGQELQSEVTDKCPKGIKFGEIVVTKSYRLQGCKWVFHGALEEFSTARNIGDLYKFIVCCLSEADSRKCEKIAFPAIGTGRHGYHPDQVACAMFSAVRSFEQKKRHLREVLFVIYDEDQYTIKEFRKQKECNEAVKRLAEDTGKLRISIDYGALPNIFTTSIIYVWDSKSSHTAKLKEHALLSHVGADVQKAWKNHNNLDTLMEREQNLAAPVVNSNTNDMAFSDTDFPKDCNNRSNLHTGKEKADTLKEREQYLATPVVNSNTDDKTFSDTDIPKDGNYGSNLHTKEEQADTLTEREQYLATPVVNSHTDDKAFSDADISKDGNHGSDSHSWEEQADTLTEREQYLATPVVNRNTNEIF